MRIRDGKSKKYKYKYLLFNNVDVEDSIDIAKKQNDLLNENCAHIFKFNIIYSVFIECEILVNLFGNY